MNDEQLKEISNKLTVVIKLLIGRDETYNSGGVESIIKLLEGAGFSNQEMADVGGASVKTIANIKSKMKKIKESGGGEKS